MYSFLGSLVKEEILLYLGLRGGSSGRRLARVLQKSPTQIFKALRQLEKGGLIKKISPNPFYFLNSQYIFYDEFIQMITKKAKAFKKYPHLPKIPKKREIDVWSVYELLSLRGRGPKKAKLSDTLRKKYA